MPDRPDASVYQAVLDHLRKPLDLTEWTDPSVYQGILDGAEWADPTLNPAEIDWTARLAAAAIPFKVVNGRPVNPAAPTGIERGRNELGHWGEQQCADAVVLATGATGSRFILLIERADGHGFALPGGYVDQGETAVDAAVRELAEEAGLGLPVDRSTALPARVVPDPRASDEAWMVTTPHVFTLDCSEGRLPEVTGADDAVRAVWVFADSYADLRDDLARRFRGHVFLAHRDLLAEVLG